MSISLNCPGCGKALKVKDEWAGKSATCPECGAKFAVPGGSASRGGQTVYNPAAAAAQRATRKDSTPKLAISPTLVTGAIVVAALIAALAIFKLGPLSAKAKWESMSQQAESDVLDVVSRALQAHLSQRGAYDPSKPHAAPRARDVTFFWSTFVMSLPDSIGFAGTSTDGVFKGKFHPHNGEVEADVDVGGAGLTGVGAMRKATGQIRVTGRVKNGIVEVEIDGKKAEIAYPKSLGN